MSSSSFVPPPSSLKERTREYALRIVRMYAAMPKTSTAQVLGKQLLRSGTSVGAQYREATRSRSSAEFVSKIESALQEIEETRYWLELVVGADVVKLDRIQPLLHPSSFILPSPLTSIRDGVYSGL